MSSHPKKTDSISGIGRVIHAHPTVSESVMEAAEGVHDVTIHM